MEIGSKMPSLVPGFAYDIFISYRQKDNKYDGWVSEFIDNLRKELEATFKEDVTVYFDINPHDGLLESYDVGESLKEKLKCLIFIPIISRTYCDPKSFAWEHEFKAFIDQASNDQFGLKIKLPNGNVANRVLPVRIHDIDDDDIDLYETTLGGVLRGVEFIYKEAGINRSLTRDDDVKKNLNNTRYRNQMNKVALAIKEITLGLKTVPRSEPSNNLKPADSSLSNNKPEKYIHRKKISVSQVQKFLSGLFLSSMLIIAALYFIPKVFPQDKFKEIKDHAGKISIAVMPFNNLTSDTTLNWFGRGISSLIINGLGNSQQLSIADEYTMFDVFEGMNQVYASGISGSMAREVAGKLGAETYISGSIHGNDTLYLILVNLVNTRTGDVIWTYKVKGDLKSTGYLDIANELCNKIKNFLEIKALEASSDYDFREAYPRSSEAYKTFIEGMNSMMARDYGSSINSFRKALEIDSTFTFASFFLAWAYSTTDQDMEARKWTIKAYRYKDRIPPQYQSWLEQWYAFYVSKNLSDIIRYTNLLEDSGIQSRWLWYDIGSTYSNFMQQYDKAISAFQRVMEISLKRGSYWKNRAFYLGYGKILHKLDRHREEKEIYRIYESLFPEDERILALKASCLLTMGDIGKANINLRKIIGMATSGIMDEISLEMTLGTVYQDADKPEMAIEHYSKAYKAEKEKNIDQSKSYFGPAYSLSHLLIDSDLDIDSGMDIVNKNLAINPDNWLFLGLKGWGLFKQGKNKEALEFLKQAEKNSVYFDFEVYQHIQIVEKAIPSQ